MNCETCDNPTKYTTGFWDGENGTHGRLYDCHNLDCEIKQKRDNDINTAEEERAKVIAINEINGIRMDAVRLKRLKLHISIREMAKRLCVSPSMYSNYEQCRKALPVEAMDRIKVILDREAEEPKSNYMNDILKKYGRGR